MFKTILLLSLGISSIIGLAFFFILSPSKEHTRMYVSQGAKLDPSILKLLKMFGGDVLSILPDDKLRKEVKSSQLEMLFKKSANPWNITMQEFYVLKFVFLGIGIVLSLTIGVASMISATTIGYFLLPIPPILLYYYPTYYYNGIGKERELRFKTELPEAIDFLIMALSSGGYTLNYAFEHILEFLQDGIIKDEFTQIVNDLNTGKTMEQSLLSFADRSPSDSIRIFTKALINANTKQVSMQDILKARAKESRRELELEIEKKIITLATKTTMVITPTSVICLILLSLSPSVYLIINSF